MPRYRYLTRTFVEVMQPDPCVVLVGSPVVYFLPEGAKKPPSDIQLKKGVRFEGDLYIKSDCGLSYDYDERMFYAH